MNIEIIKSKCLLPEIKVGDFVQRKSQNYKVVNIDETIEPKGYTVMNVETNDEISTEPYYVTSFKHVDITSSGINVICFIVIVAFCIVFLAVLNIYCI